MNKYAYLSLHSLFMAGGLFLFLNISLFAQSGPQPTQNTVATLSDHSFTWISPDTIHTALDGYPKFKVLVKNNGTGRSPDPNSKSYLTSKTQNHLFQ